MILHALLLVAGMQATPADPMAVWLRCARDEAETVARSEYGLGVAIPYRAAARRVAKMALQRCQPSFEKLSAGIGKRQAENEKRKARKDLIDDYEELLKAIEAETI